MEHHLSKGGKTEEGKNPPALAFIRQPGRLRKGTAQFFPPLATGNPATFGKRGKI
ncbi:hypothetical protein ACTL6U_15915 [Rhodovibrionaceae bacterium A322]